jgi:hypothetical protein
MRLGQAQVVSRLTDPETSWRAAQSVAHVRESQALVWTVIEDQGPMCDESLVRWLHGALTPSGARTRRKELTDLGLIEDSGHRETTLAGRLTIVWRAVSLKRWQQEQLARASQPNLL